MKNFFTNVVWARLELPLGLLLVHCVVSVCAVASIALTELVLRALGLDGKAIPGYNVTLGSWMFDLEIFAASAILIAGILEAGIIIILGIMLDSVARVRDFIRSWR